MVSKISIQKNHSALAASFEHGVSRLNREDLHFITHTSRLADSSSGLTQPHPNSACILVSPDGKVLSSAYQHAQGTTSSEVLAVAASGEATKSSTAYLNLETGGDCDGEPAALNALLLGGVQRVVLGMRHPLDHARGRAVCALRAAGLVVDVLGEAFVSPEDSQLEAAALQACTEVNEPLLHRAVLKRPMSILKYAMTLDGKIATQSGHSAWVTSPPARSHVFEQRARSDAVIVGGNTVRRDNPRLTTRREGGHAPVRIVMSRTLELPADAELWDVTVAPTIVMTQRGAKRRFQSLLKARGVEVVEFDFLNPECVADYCYQRGFLQCFWECGGILAAPCISGNVIHKVMAFVAPKIIGGARAPSPVGELGFVEMTQALELHETQWSQVGPDLMLLGYLPISKGPLALHAALSDKLLTYQTSSTPDTSISSREAQNSLTVVGVQQNDSPGNMQNAGMSNSAMEAEKQTGERLKEADSSSANIASSSKNTARIKISNDSKKMQGASLFYKCWDRWGGLGNFSPHPIEMSTPGNCAGLSISESFSPLGPEVSGRTPPADSTASAAVFTRMYASVEHFYQSSKFLCTTEEGRLLAESVAAMQSPEEAARLGRLMQRTRPDLLRPDWDQPETRISVMESALRAKFTTHQGPRALLLATKGLEVIEASPHDFFWGSGIDGSGRNELGKLLMKLREEYSSISEAS
ncbi:hypothetical protein CEUSTIGMA_g11826.t1 [Chlamydomonas eustigma]|uniref:5-amino-6-(5-phosphoribosylamino)uracil reductase n=1 Tax=Chlamydomonas eustigma TaxID=1157962 RepID=A0A250XMU7_9CHLO|nr:hypothetical protein CEUSTIGMA_g11826.t1 [Chlamydomonas eustigma]|eukprot:GAX84404.1 hypothetical protein CEUSTIGMA_g11826.t1 [Chlamydomonas eustigma]